MTVRPAVDRGARSCALALLTVAIVVLGAACSDGEQVPAATFEARLVEREGITVEQAECVRSYVYDAYSDGAIAQLHESELESLPAPLWSEYSHAMVACVLGEQLGVERPADAG